MSKKMMIPRISDAVLITKLSSVASTIGIREANFQMAGVAINNAKLNPLDARIMRFTDKGGNAIDVAAINNQSFNFTYHRGGAADPKNPVLDEVQFTFNDRQAPLTEEQKLQIIEVISEEFIVVDIEASISAPLKAQSDIVASHAAVLSRLEQLNERLIESGNEFRKSIEEEFIERAKTLEEKYKDREADLHKQSVVHAGELREREAELERKLREIDNRENTHVRRELRTQILNEVKSRTAEFRLSDSTNNMRIPIHAVSGSLILVLGASAVYFASQLLELIGSAPSNILGIAVLSVKQVAVSVGFGFAVVFYLRWMNTWAATHANAEFSVRQFQLDIERASWAVETALEWRSTPEGKIPPELLESITNGLFASAEDGVKEYRPADELASALLGSASKIRIAAGNSEVEIDAKRLRSGQPVRGA